MPTAIKLAIDKTGRSTDNKVLQEPHSLPNRRVRAIVPDYGAFFKESLKVFDAATMQPLASTQYEAIEMYVALSQECGKEVCAGILILDESVSDNVLVDYQAYGGPWSYSSKEIFARYADAQQSDIPINYEDLIGKPKELPPDSHPHDAKDVYGLEGIRNILNRISNSIRIGDKASHDELQAFISTVIDGASDDSGEVIDELMAFHLAAINPHAQYVMKTDISRLVAVVRRPVNLAPVAGANNVLPSVKLQASVFGSYYGLTHKAAQFQASKLADFSVMFFDVTVGGVTEYQPAAIFTPSSTFYWRVRYQDDENVWSDWSEVTTFSTSAVSVVKPAITSPAYDSNTQTEMPTFTSGAFSVVGGSDTHQSSDWEVWTGPNGTGSRAYSLTGSTTAKTSMTVPKQTLAQNTKYYVRVRYRGTQYGYSPWSDDLRVNSVWPLRPTVIGEVFGGGYWGGDIVLSDGTYAIIVAPKASGERSGALTNDTSQRNNYSLIDSVANTNALPLEQTVAWVKSLTIGGFSDWTIPAANVMTKLWENLRPSLAAAPVAFKTGGAEAFQPNYYWTSTGYTYVDTYTTDPTPVYDWVSHSDCSNSTTDWESHGMPDIGCSQGEVSNVSYSFGEAQINPETGRPDGMLTVSWCCNWEEYEVVSYEPGETITDYYYYAYMQSMGTSNTRTFTPKYDSRLARAVRLVKVA